MTHRNILKIMSLPVILAMIFISCATKIKMQVEHPPILNTAGIKRIAIMPFESKNFSTRAMARYVTAVVTKNIEAANYFTLVDPAEIEVLRKNNQSLDDYVDALLVGQVTKVSNSVSNKKGTTKKSDGTIEIYYIFTTNTGIEFNYSLERVRDGSRIGPVSRKGSKTASSRVEYPPSDTMLKAIVDDQLKNVDRDFAPYYVTEKRGLVKDKSGDKELQAEMKSARALVKAKDNTAALEAYLGIYRKYNSTAAGENAAILHESFGNFGEAANIMQKIYNDTGNPKAQEAVARLNKILQDQAVLDSDYYAASSQISMLPNFPEETAGTANIPDQTVKAAAYAGKEIRKVLPGNAVVWLYYNASGNTMVKTAVDNIEADLFRNGVSLINRNNPALIEAEQNFIMSGYVSNDDFAGAAKATGANTIVIIGMTGSGDMRYLQVRVLDTEKNTFILSSDNSEDWRL